MVSLGGDRLDDDGLLDLVWLTPDEAAAAVQVSRQTVYYWVSVDAVKWLRAKRRLLVEEQSLYDCELAMRQAPSGRPRRGTTRGPARKLTR